MPKTHFELPTHVPESVARPIYAGVGATDLAVEVVREYVADLQKRFGEMQKTVSGIDYDPNALRAEAQKRAQDASKVVTAGVASLNKSVTGDAQARRAAAEKRFAELQAEAVALPGRLQKLWDAQVGTAGDTYGVLITRGETLVGRIMGQQSTQEAAKAVETTVTKAKSTKTQAAKTAKSTQSTAKKAASKSATSAKKSPAKSSAKATATAAKKAAESTAQAATEGAEKIGD
jgi:hypothetical protein